MNKIWVVGNGPSLSKINLDALAGETSIGCNKIHRIYEKTKWRPTHYVKVDYVPGEEWRDSIMLHIDAGEECLLWDAFRFGADPYDGNYEYIQYGIGDFVNASYIPRCEHTALGTGGWHLPEICTGNNSILPMIQWAVTLGADEIYLIGCDGNYKKGHDHFVPDYYSRWDETYEQRNNQKVREAHEIAKSGCHVPVYICSKTSAFSDIWPYRGIKEALHA